jgi:DMSO/TMAO reductase YedYZ molybdopterin-dependent catalytic subunit
MFSLPSRRAFLARAGLAALALAAKPARADDVVRLPLAGDPRERPIANDFPLKYGMTLQRSRPPLLETPFEVFDNGAFTPNDKLYVRWHWALIPNAIDVKTFKLSVRGHVNKATFAVARRHRPLAARRSSERCRSA